MGFHEAGSLGVLMQPEYRNATHADIDALVRIENAAFEADRISRRSFRQLIDRETAETVVAVVDGEIAGYFMVLFRRGSGVARLYSLAVAPGHTSRGLGGRLLQVAEKTAYDHGRLFLRLEVREDNARAIALYKASGYRLFGRHLEYYTDHTSALRFEKLLRGAPPDAAVVPYFEQTADFTCGPACLMMAMAAFSPGFVPDPVMEIRLWREATTVFMMSGPGGCEPYGLAVTAHEHGLAARIAVSVDGPLFLQSVRDAEKRRVMELAQIDFRARAESHAIPVEIAGFGLDDIRAGLAGGELVVVLVSGYMMFGKKVPHWVLAIGADPEHIFIHDPWIEDERGETAADAANIPVPNALFMSMAQFGREGLRAAVFLGKRTQ